MMQRREKTLLVLWRLIQMTDGSGLEDGNIQKSQIRTKYDRMFERKNQDISLQITLATSSISMRTLELKMETLMNFDGFMEVKRRIPADLPLLDSVEATQDDSRFVHVDGIKDPILIDSKRAEKRLSSKKKLLKYRPNGQKWVFDEDGNPKSIDHFEDEEDFLRRGRLEEQRQLFIEGEKEKVVAHDQEDKQLQKQKRDEKKERRKARERQEKDNKGAVAYVEQDEADVGRDLVQEFIDDAEGVSSNYEGSDEEPAPIRARNGLKESQGRRKRETKLTMSLIYRIWRPGLSIFLTFSFGNSLNLSTIT